MSFLLATSPPRIRFAVAAETPNSTRTSAFMIYGCISRYFLICYQRVVALSVIPSLTSSLALMASMIDALVLILEGACPPRGVNIIPRVFKRCLESFDLVICLSLYQLHFQTTSKHTVSFVFFVRKYPQMLEKHTAIVSLWAQSFK